LVLVGKALKLSRWFTHCDKQYEGTIQFGVETDTLDPEGTVTATAPLPSREAVEQALPQFCGEIQQAPPAYSAIHIDGERASALARKGETPEMQKRPVTIYRLELRTWEPPFARIFVHCSSGTYIRSLARDIAVAVGSRAHLTGLVRTKVAGFGLSMSNESMSNEQLAMSNERRAMSKEQGIRVCPINRDVFEKLNISCLDISPEKAKNVAQGKPLANILCDVQPFSGELGNVAALFSGEDLIAVIEKSQLPNKWNYGYVYANN
jgi:tRNA pseudouridine55 synthase